MLKTQALEAWLAKAGANGIKQRSPEWIVARDNYVSGSAIATLAGKNPYSSLKKLLAEKAGISTIETNVAMNWGTVFEDVLRKYVEKKKGLQIVGGDLFVTPEDKPLFAYSPDGLAVDAEDRIVLLEFKCPWKRGPNGTVPGHYVPQVKMGLAMIDVADVGLYVEGVFRKCFPDQMDMSREYDSEFEAFDDFEEVCAFGYIEFATDTAYEYRFDNIAEAGWRTFTDILSRAAAGELRTTKYIFYSDEEYKAHAPVPAEGIAIGRLYWKLLRADMHYIEKDPNYLAPFADLANSLLTDSRKVRGGEEEYEKIRKKY